MKLLSPTALFRRARKVVEPALAPILEPVASLLPDEESTLLKTVGLLSAALGAIAVGLVIGRELRQRYKFNRRTPYDLYAHSGDEREMEFGVGV